MCMCVAWHEERLLFTASENTCVLYHRTTDSERKMLADSFIYCMHLSG